MIFRSGAGSSLVSQADAARQANENAQRNVAATLRAASGDRDNYAYAVDRQLEPLVETLSLPGGDPAAQVTINSYGALIVNARSALFVDVDTRRDDEDAEEPGANDRAAASLRAAVEQNPEIGFRVYRTRNGWRYLCTSRVFDPAAAETHQFLAALGADDKYVLLCRVQSCFRARLTPKPWRIGERFFDVHPSEIVTRKRLESYLRKSAPFASAAFTAEVGRAGPPVPELQLIVDYHDQWCAAHSGKPLA